MIDHWSDLLQTGSPLIDNIVHQIIGRGQPRQIRASKSRRKNPPGRDTIEGEYRVLEDPTPMLVKLYKSPNGIIGVLGARGTGKTALSLAIAQFLNRPIYAIGISPQAMDDLGTSIGPDEIDTVPDGSTIIIDDAGLSFGTRDYAQEASQKLHDLLATVRHRDIMIIANSTSSATMDRYLLDADIIFLKPVSRFHAEAERRGIQKFMDKATEVLLSIPESQRQSYAYVISDVYNFEGLIYYHLPRGFNERISKNKRSF